MSLIRTGNRGGLAPWRSSWNLSEEIDRMFQELGARSVVSGQEVALPLDVRETEDAFIVEADIPGLKKEDVHIEVTDNVIEITGERKSEHKEKRKDYHRVERQFGSFRRTVALPGGFNHESINAEFEDGVLRVTLPKPAEAKPRHIKVKSK